MLAFALILHLQSTLTGAELSPTEESNHLNALKSLESVCSKFDAPSSPLVSAQSIIAYLYHFMRRPSESISDHNPMGKEQFEELYEQQVELPCKSITLIPTQQIKQDFDLPGDFIDRAQHLCTKIRRSLTIGQLYKAYLRAKLRASSPLDRPLAYAGEESGSDNEEDSRIGISSRLVPSLKKAKPIKLFH